MSPAATSWLDSWELWHTLALLGLILIILDVVLWTQVILPLGIGLVLTAGASLGITSNIVLTYIGTGIVALCYGVFYSVFFKLAKTSRVSAATPMDSYLGKSITILTPVTHTEPGEVTIFGERWSARSEHGGSQFQPHDPAVITKITGNQLIIGPPQLPQNPSGSSAPPGTS